MVRGKGQDGMSPSPGEPPADPISEQQVKEAAVDGVATNASAVESGQQLFNGCVCMQWVMTAVMLAVHSTTPNAINAHLHAAHCV